MPFFFAMVVAGCIFSLLTYIIYFAGLRLAFPKSLEGLTYLEIGKGILAEFSTVSIWGRLGRKGSR